MAEETSQTQSSASTPASTPTDSPVPSSPTKVIANTVPPVSTPQAESVYTKDELLDAAKALGTTRAVVAGAMHFAGKDRMTKSEAKKAIATFLQRKV